MNIKCYGTPGEFLTENADFLKRFEVGTQLSFGNAVAHQDEPCHPGMLFGRCEQDGETALLFSNTLPWNLLLHAIPGNPAALSAAVLLAEYLRRENISIHGVNASRQLCDAFNFAYIAAPSSEPGTGSQRFVLRTAMDIMELRTLIEPPAVSGTARPARPEELETVTDWACAFQEEALGEQPDRPKLQEHFRDWIEKENLYVLELPDGALASMAAVSNRNLPHGVGISWVYTPRELRGRGYCQNTVAALCRDLLGAGAEYVTLFVDKKNPFSNRVYAKLGFQILEDNFDYRLEDV